MAGRAIVAVHGGAGNTPRSAIGDARADAGLEAVEESLRVASKILGEGSALDAVVAAVRVLEDCEELNAGRGAALTEDGTVELSAAVADGSTRGFGAVAGVTRPRNPVELARLILEERRHVLVIGEAADELAERWGLEIVDSSYFVTERQRRAVEPSGTVGAVALDDRGHLAAATSTGGVRGQRRGRVGDSPIPGAGTWADDSTSAVSATGDGEFFLRTAFAHDVHARMRYQGVPLEDACTHALAEVAALGGKGGCVAVDSAGNLALPFTSAAMFRGWCRPGETPRTGLDAATPTG